jgi:hypothetical protein
LLSLTTFFLSAARVNKQIGSLNNLNNTTTKFKTFFEKTKFLVRLDGDDKNLNDLSSIKNDSSSAVVIPTPFNTENIFHEIKEKKDLKQYYTLINESFKSKDAKVKNEQSTRKNNIKLESSIKASIESIKGNFDKVNELFEKSTKDAQHCINVLEAEYVNPEILKACEVSTANNVNKNISQIEAALKSIKIETSKAVSKYIVGSFEYSGRFTDILAAKNYFKALKELNDKLVVDYAKFEDYQRATSTFKNAAKEIFDIILDLQVDTADIINSSNKGSITEKTKGAELGDYNFNLNYDKYFKKINAFAKKQFNKGIEKFSKNQEFNDIEIFEQVKTDLDNELNSYCPTLGFAGTEEDQMYCEFKGLVSEINVVKGGVHPEL